MNKLSADMVEFIKKQRLGFVATVCSDGTPNLSPKGTTTVWNNNQLVFADICSPQTIRNLLLNPAIEINIVDPISRKGYRIKGNGKVLKEGELFNTIINFYKASGVVSPIKNIVLVDVVRALEVFSPAYDQGYSEEEIKERWRAYYAEL